MKYIFECHNEAELKQLRDKLLSIYPLNNAISKFDLDSELDSRTLIGSRIHNVLNYEGITTYRHLTQITYNQLRSYNNLGKRSADYIVRHLNELGLTLKT